MCAIANPAEIVVMTGATIVGLGFVVIGLPGLWRLDRVMKQRRLDAEERRHKDAAMQRQMFEQVLKHYRPNFEPQNKGTHNG